MTYIVSGDLWPNQLVRFANIFFGGFFCSDTTGAHGQLNINCTWLVYFFLVSGWLYCISCVNGNGLLSCIFS